MKQSSKRFASIGLALVFVVAALLVFFDLVEPTYGDVQTVKGEVAGEQMFLATANKAVSQAQQLITQYQSDSQSEQNLALAMPTGQDIAGALAQIYGLAQNSGLAVQTIGISAPSLVTNQGSTAPAVTTAATTGATAAETAAQIVDPLGTISLQVAAAGSYESLKNFISGLETNVRLFDIKSISITPAPSASGSTKGAETTGGDFFTYAINVATYYQTGQTN